MGNEQSSGANIDDLRQHNVPIKLPPAKPGKKSQVFLIHLLNSHRISAIFVNIILRSKYSKQR